MRKMAKMIALRLADKIKEEKAKELSREEKKNSNLQQNKNLRGKSTAQPVKGVQIQTSGSSVSSNTGPNTGKTTLSNNQVKLPKVPHNNIVSNSNSSVKAISDNGSAKKTGYELVSNSR
jgi:hypothetical protein